MTSPYSPNDHRHHSQHHIQTEINKAHCVTLNGITIDAIVAKVNLHVVQSRQWWCFTNRGQRHVEFTKAFGQHESRAAIDNTLGYDCAAGTFQLDQAARHHMHVARILENQADGIWQMQPVAIAIGAVQV